MKKSLKSVMMIVVFLILSNSMVFGEDSSFPLTGVIGLSPNSMGTLGEVAMLNYRPLPYLQLGVGGTHDKIHQQDLEIEKLGANLLGEINKDIWSGVFQLGGVLHIGPIELIPYASYVASISQESTMARVISGSPYPQDTFSFVDIDEEIRRWGPLANLQASASFGNFSVGLGGSWSPIFQSSNQSDFLQTIPAINGSALNYQWRENHSEYTTNGTKILLQGRMGLQFEKLPMGLSAFFNYDSFTHSGKGTTDNTLYHALSADPIILDDATSSELGNLNGTFTSLEAGIRVHFTMREATPILDLSYIRVIDDRTYEYYLIDESEKWIDDYYYIQISLKWGF